jgi:hypothetical protein
MKTRLMQFLDFKGINKSQFYKKTGFSNGFLDKVNDITTGKVEIILKNYPEISLEWLILGKGEMLKNNNYPVVEETFNTINESETVCNNYITNDSIKEEYINLLKDTLNSTKLLLEDCKKEVELLKKK